MKCQHKGCEREATHIPAVNVPAMHWPIDAHEPMKLLFLDWNLCRDHAGEAMLKEDFLSPANEKMREIFTIGAQGKMPPDFDRAFFSLVRIGSKEHTNFIKVQGGGHTLQ